MVGESAMGQDSGVRAHIRRTGSNLRGRLIYKTRVAPHETEITSGGRRWQTHPTLQSLIGQ